MIDLLTLIEVSLAGFGTGALYAVTALAFVLIYKATQVINLAIGEILMLGAYLFFGAAAGLALPIWVALLAALAGAALFGALVERTVIRPMLGESPISVFMVTIGLGSVLVGFVELIWGPDSLRLPEFMPRSAIFLGEVIVSPKIGYGSLAAFAVIAVFLVVFRFWRGAGALRATAGDQAAAYSMGINVPAVFSAAWVLACMVAAGAGVLVGAIGGLAPTMGVFGLSVLVVVIVGGLDSILGALVGGLFIGLLEALAGFYLGGEFKLLATFGILVAVLMIRPHGLFGTVEIERL